MLLYYVLVVSTCRHFPRGSSCQGDGRPPQRFSDANHANDSARPDYSGGCIATKMLTPKDQINKQINKQNINSPSQPLRASAPFSSSSSQSCLALGYAGFRSRVEMGPRCRQTQFQLHLAIFQSGVDNWGDSYDVRLFMFTTHSALYLARYFASLRCCLYCGRRMGQPFPFVLAQRRTETFARMCF